MPDPTLAAQLSWLSSGRAGISQWNNWRRASNVPVDLSGVDLTGFDLYEANLSGANLKGALLSKCKLRYVNFTGADLSAAVCTESDLRAAGLEDANLAGAQLERSDLSYAHLRAANLARARLGSAQLVAADLTKASIAGADCVGADFTTAILLEVDARKANLQRSILVGSNATGAILCEADLSHADLESAVFSEAELVDAKLTRTIAPLANFKKADLRKADLQLAICRGADFTSANLDLAALRGTNLANASLRSATLRSTSLIEANLQGALLEDACLDNAEVGHTVLADCDLSPLCRARNIRFVAPCAVDFRAIVRSTYEPRLGEFLRRTGMPEVFVEYNVSCGQALSGSERKSMLQTSFISYGGPDQGFAERLNQALLDQGVTTFLFSKDAVPGTRLSRVMHEGVNNYDRVILVCSKNSLQRPGVLNEIQETLDREARDGGAEYLIPIRLDEYVLSDWAPSSSQLARAVRSRVVADFSAPDKFADGVASLLRALIRTKV